VDEDWKLPCKMDALKFRAAMTGAIRRFFLDQDFLEIETPLRIPAPAPESQIEPIVSGDWVLQTSPELCMKRLLAAGYPKIFQICKCFRAGERGAHHLPEFTMLEWYRTGTDYLTLMDDCETLISHIAGALGLGDTVSRQGERICLTPPWERITVREAFCRYAGLSVEEALRSDRFDERMVCAIEPHLGRERPVFLYEYPATLGALARLKSDDRKVAERFELYIGGLELANAFSELTDSAEQRRRFNEASRDRRQKNRPAYPLPERFLASLSRMPPSAGIALGLDRLAMLLADQTTIDAVVAFTPESL
jgi:elongation factor P--(R)-beta-lysine ligase